MIRSVVLVLLSCVVMLGCSRRPPVPPSSSAPRVVVLSPALAITMHDLGMAHLIVGRHAWDTVTDPSVPICGDQSGLDYETLLRVNPTHVLTQWGTRELPARLSEYAQSRDWQLKDFRLLELREISQCADDLVALFGSEIDTAQCRFDPSRSISTQINERFARIESIESTDTTLLLASIEPIAAFGPGSWHAQLLESLGGRSAIIDGSAYITLDLEDVIRRLPQQIVLFAPRSSDAPQVERSIEDTLAMLGAMADHDSIPAIASRRVAIIDHPHALTPSTAMVDVADELRALLIEWDAAHTGLK